MCGGLVIRKKDNVDGPDVIVLNAAAGVEVVCGGRGGVHEI